MRASRLTRAPGSVGAVTATVTPSIARAAPSPKALLARRPCADRGEIVVVQVQGDVAAVGQRIGQARSTVAPLGIRPTLGTFTETREPSLPCAPKPLTIRLLGDGVDLPVGPGAKAIGSEPPRSDTALVEDTVMSIGWPGWRTAARHGSQRIRHVLQLRVDVRRHVHAQLAEQGSSGSAR